MFSVKMSTMNAYIALSAQPIPRAAGSIAQRLQLSAFRRSARDLLTWPVFLGRHERNLTSAIEILQHDFRPKKSK